MKFTVVPSNVTRCYDVAGTFKLFLYRNIRDHFAFSVFFVPFDRFVYIIQRRGPEVQTTRHARTRIVHHLFGLEASRQRR